jgi:hypothetical protein
MLLAAACGDTVEIGGPMYDGGAGRPSTSSTTGTAGSGTTSGSTTATGTTGAGGSDPGTTGAGGNPGTTGAGGDPGTTGAGGNPGTTGAGGTRTTGAGGTNPGTGGAGGAGGGGTCGGLRGAQCPVGQYCDYEPNAMCGAADQTGICRPNGTGGCTADCPGVCGCDGKFYCNACGAHMAGTDDSTDRSCIGRDSGTPRLCGGLVGAQCAANEYCDYPPAFMCGITDGSGTCQPRPQNCTRDCPGVCGCDGKFYCNACVAQQSGVDDSPNQGCLRDR